MAFTQSQYARAHLFLATRVVTMMGRKFEEGDWAEVYCAAKDIPLVGWSNLNIDIVYRGLGVEHKMLCYRATTVMEACGTTLMHPSLTRSVRIPSVEADPNSVMRDVLTQYGELVELRRMRVRTTAEGAEPDMRTGWLLWQASLREFLYFEEEMLAPNPDDYRAEWRESGGGGRKTSRNLWVYEKDTGKKRYSVTTSAGAKIQPYLDVPPPDDPFLYRFVVQGLHLGDNLVRIWVAANTARELSGLVGSLEPGELSSAILHAAREASTEPGEAELQAETAQPLEITKEAYEVMKQTWVGVSDEHSVELLIRALRRAT